MKLKLLYIILIFIIPVTSLGQSVFERGYLVLNDGDTSFGYIGKSDYYLNKNLCGFKTSLNSKEVQYQATSIKLYRFNSGKLYESHSVEVNGETQHLFLECIFKGDLSFYYYPRNSVSNGYYAQKGNGKLELLVYEEGERLEDGNRVKYRKKTFLGVLSLYTYGCKEAEVMLQTINQPSHKGLFKLAEKYQKNCGSDPTNFDYSKEVENVKVIRGNVMLINYFELRSIIPSYNLEFLVNNSSFNERLFMGFGVRYEQFESINGEVENWVRGSVSINYLNSKKGISPIAGYQMLIGKHISQNLYLGGKLQGEHWGVNITATAETFNFFTVEGVSFGIGLYRKF